LLLHDEEAPMTAFNTDVPAGVKKRLERGETAIRAYREHHNVPLSELALRAGINEVALDAAENGMRSLDRQELERLAGVLAIPVAHLELANVAKALGEAEEEAGDEDPNRPPYT
jgi:transcriptional regulator with XRE-family HTH domain